MTAIYKSNTGETLARTYTGKCFLSLRLLCSKSWLVDGIDYKLVGIQGSSCSFVVRN